MSTPFKMKGSPMQRNFGIGSPLHDHEKDEEGNIITHTTYKNDPRIRALSKGDIEAKAAIQEEVHSMDPDKSKAGRIMDTYMTQGYISKEDEAWLNTYNASKKKKAGN